MSWVEAATVGRDDRPGVRNLPRMTNRRTRPLIFEMVACAWRWFSERYLVVKSFEACSNPPKNTLTV